MVKNVFKSFSPFIYGNIFAIHFLRLQVFCLLIFVLIVTSEDNMQTQFFNNFTWSLNDTAFFLSALITNDIFFIVNNY